MLRDAILSNTKKGKSKEVLLARIKYHIGGREGGREMWVGD
jgi:hypothetical protein